MSSRWVLLTCQEYISVIVAMLSLFGSRFQMGHYLHLADKVLFKTRRLTVKGDTVYRLSLGLFRLNTGVDTGIDLLLVIL